jgi:predicted aspartyl protease
MFEQYYYDASKDLVHLPGTIYGPVAKHYVKFIFDPGAYRTIISTSLIDEVGYQATSNSKQVSSGSIAGREHGYTVVVSKLSILSFEFSDIEIASFDLPPQYGVDGLLGLDLLEKLR